MQKASVISSKNENINNPDNIHPSIYARLQYFHDICKIPNIIFHGNSGCGKKTIVHNFIQMIYNPLLQNDTTYKLSDYVMYVNCAFVGGIKFIREDLKFFAKTHIYTNRGHIFKSIILVNADKLTIDAQSVMRRCIEQFSHNTRFFIIIKDKYKLLKPILSRFCEIYVPSPIINNTVVHNLYKYNINHVQNNTEINNRYTWLYNELKKINIRIEGGEDIQLIHDSVIKFYEKGYSGIDIMHILKTKNFKHISSLKESSLLFYFNIFKKDIKNEKHLMFCFLYFMFLSLDEDLENISFM